MKKTLAGMVTALLLFCMVFGSFAFDSDAAASVSVSVGNTSVNVGDSITATITVTSDELIGGVGGYIYYNSEVLQYNGADGGDGYVRVAQAFSAQGDTSITLSVTFTAIAAGSSDIGFDEAPEVLNIEEEEISGVSVSGTSVIVSGGADEGTATEPTDTSSESEALLSELSLQPGTIYPSFNSNTYSYTATVYHSVESIEVNAVSENSSDTVDISGADELEDGENTITISVTSQSGESNTYTVTVTRLEGDEGDDLDDEDDDNSYDTESIAEVTVGDKQLYLSNDFDDDDIPDGYIEGEIVIGEDTVRTAVGEYNGLTLVYLLKSESGSLGEFYIYDEATGTYSPFLTFSNGDAEYVLLQLQDTSIIPTEFKQRSITYKKHEATVWTYGSTEEYFMFYGMNPTGETGLYIYDTVEGTVQRYLEILRDNTEEIEQYKTQANEYKLQNNKIKLMFVGGCVGVVVLILIMIVIMLNLGVKISMQKAMLRKLPEETLKRISSDDDEEENVVEDVAKVIEEPEDVREEITDFDDIKKEVEEEKTDSNSEEASLEDDSNKAEDSDGDSEELKETDDTSDSNNKKNYSKNKRRKNKK